MNIRKRMLKVANNIMEDVVKSFEMTEEEWKKYSELHPNAKRENHQIVPNRKNQDGNDRKIEMTEEQELLHRLSTHEDGDLRAFVAINKKVHPLTLEKLSNDKNWGVRMSVADNIKTHPIILDKLSEDKNYKVRYSVAKNPNTRDETLEKLSNDESSNVRKTAKENLAKRKNNFNAI